MKVVGKKHYKQYTLKDILGQGSFGKVYYSPPYAIKEMNFKGLPPFVTNALKNEINILNKINHQNVVKLIDFFYEGQCVYLVMEYCEQDLSKFLKKNKCDEKLAVHIFKQLIFGFRELVNLGIIHRDLKPANILVNSKGEFKLADFGFAKYVDNYDSKLLYSIVGSPLYMAPQILNKTQYTTKSDIWSLGFVFYELLTGTYPWMGMSEADLFKNITTRPLNVPNNISAFSKELIIRMLKINEKERISWEELFEIVLANNNNKSPEKMRIHGREGRMERENSKENKENGRTPSKKKLFPLTPNKEEKKEELKPLSGKKIQEQKENVKIPKEENKMNEMNEFNKVNVSEGVIKEVFIMELQRIYGEGAQSMLMKPFFNLSELEKQQFEKTIINFNEDFQRVVRNIFQVSLK